MFSLFKKRKKYSEPLENADEKTSMKKYLIGIGYWHNDYQTDLPDPGRFVDESWSENDRELISRYLRSAYTMPYAAGGVSWCRFRCGNVNLGAQEFTDGKYIWPEGLPHYIDEHKVRLPQEVIDYMLSNKNIEPVKDNFEIDTTWWKTQTGWNEDVKTFRDPYFDRGILTIVQVHSKLKLKQGDLLRSYLAECHVNGRLHAVDKILLGEEVQLKGRFRHVADVLPKFLAVGLRGTFEPTGAEQ